MEVNTVVNQGPGAQCDAFLMSEALFIQKIVKHEFLALECLWLPRQFVLLHTKDYANYFRLDLNNLRHQVCERCDYRFVCFQ
jgi:hypothetical protein